MMTIAPPFPTLLPPFLPLSLSDLLLTNENASFANA